LIPRSGATLAIAGSRSPAVWGVCRAFSRSIADVKPERAHIAWTLLPDGAQQAACIS